jgi:hypothetical protein
MLVRAINGGPGVDEKVDLSFIVMERRTTR